MQQKPRKNIEYKYRHTAFFFVLSKVTQRIQNKVDKMMNTYMIMSNIIVSTTAC